MIHCSPRLYTTSPRIQSWYAGRYLRPDQEQRSKPDPGIAGYLPAPRQRRPVPELYSLLDARYQAAQKRYARRYRKGASWKERGIKWYIDCPDEAIALVRSIGAQELEIAS
jgi:hypothetical protein